MKTEFTKFFRAILITLILVLFADVSIGFVADRIMRKLPNYSGQLAKDNFRLHRLDTDIVIIGSSRGSHHYVTKQLNDSIDRYCGRHYSLYNAAIDGKFANSNSCAAEAIIARYYPKLVVYDISEGQLRSDKVADIEFSSPFYWTDTIIRRYLDNVGLREKLLMKSSLYRYNGKIFRIVFSFVQQVPVDDGYEPLYGSKIDTLTTNKNTCEIKPLNMYSINNFENVLKKYSSKNVPLIIVCSPSFRPNNNNLRLKALCDKYNIPFIDMYDEAYFNNNPSLFSDRTHLNNDGAHVFTALLFEQLKPYLANIK